MNEDWTGCLMVAGLFEKYFPMIMAIVHLGIAPTVDVDPSKLIGMIWN